MYSPNQIGVKKLYLILENFKPNISLKFFDCIITFVNSHHENKIQKKRSKKNIDEKIKFFGKLFEAILKVKNKLSGI